MRRDKRQREAEDRHDAEIGRLPGVEGSGGLNESGHDPFPMLA
jgi:hypothetical protein